jgi:hypothetical protein
VRDRVPDQASRDSFGDIGPRDQAPILAAQAIAVLRLRLLATQSGLSQRPENRVLCSRSERR